MERWIGCAAVCINEKMKF
ncbi:Protein of unknown function [Bacillus thuringiensis]|uniref:Uncharacterized protein n=1 Tax=Bacillus thuringiensis TaxID=1428 RepID=A0A1C4FD97_BACTU|nr:Protein of unknown function [Bacillus thuringiensis]